MNGFLLEPLMFACRTLIIGLLVYIISRYLPRRTGGTFAAYDFVFFWLLGGLLVAPLYDLKIRFLDMITAVIIVYLTHFLLSGLAMKSRKWSSWISGHPFTLIKKGKIQDKTMNQALFPIQMLISELRMSGIAKLSEVETAILETTGHLSVIKKADFMPVTTTDLNIKSPLDSPLPTVLIEDGKIMKKNLEKLGWNEAELQQRMVKAKVITPLKKLYAVIWEGKDPLYWVSKDE
ncbi:hypothetical protein ASG89_20325 [Paenibacillus sp. Soil766]|uniref:DUF421 domain-containing protein n=1 Tax=Paenibacillus sp. Soil766 TaxID=1736404 RepID=UPI00070C3EF8|nr:YetF domain-containing protein [Paenibacillus sp. Soil766]KRF05479.1 hypothetical protein ASG89_20325 [Paenibacillus sp. Soil766]